MLFWVFNIGRSFSFVSVESQPIVVCNNYMVRTPTARQLLKDGGPVEYYPMLITASTFFLANSFVFVLQIIKHFPFFRDVYFKVKF